MRTAVNVFRCIRHIQPVRRRQAQGLVAQVYAQMVRDFLLAPPILLHAPSPELTAAAWMVLRESTLAGPGSRVQREAIAAAISRMNQCPYCVEVHSMMLHAWGRHGEAGAILSGDGRSSQDESIRGVVEWASATLSPTDPKLRRLPCSEHDRAQFLGTVLAFHYINRMVHVFLEPSPFPGGWLLPAALRRGFVRAGGRIYAEAAQPPHPPGDSLKLLPPAQLPDDFAWARSNPHVAGAYSRFAAAVSRIEPWIPPKAALAVQQRLQQWNGEPAPISRRWTEDVTNQLHCERERASARFGLLAALAPYQVDVGTVQAFRRHFPHDIQLVEMAAWASFAAARRLLSWL